MEKKNRIISLVVIVSLLLLLVSCSGKKINVDDRITVDNSNISSVNAASGFIQAIFTGDEELFYSVFPAESMQDSNAFESYSNQVDSNFDFYGISFTAENDFSVENGYDADYMRSSISMVMCIPEENITSLSLVKLRVYFTNEENNDSASNDVYILTYKYDNNWYTFEMANSDADFSA